MQCPVWNSCPCSCTSWGPPWGSCSCAPWASCAHPSRGISWGWPPHCAPGDQPPHEPYQPSRPPLCCAAAAPRTPLRPVVAGPVSLCQEEVSTVVEEHRHVVEEFIHHELQQNTLGPQAGLSLALPAPSITTLRFSFYGTIASFLLT